MHPREVLLKAIQCDTEGRRLEALHHYLNGIQLLLDKVPEVTDSTKKNELCGKIRKCMDRAELIQQTVKNYTETGIIISHISIYEDSTGHSYNSLFGEYMTSKVKEILLHEPYLVERFQYQNLIAFLELAVKNCTDLKYIALVTKQDPKNPDGQSTNLKQIKDDLSKRNISMTVKLEPTLHDRKIVLGNGYIIKIGRGLHYFKATNPFYSLGLCDNDFRMCRQTDVDIWRTKPIS